MNIVIKPNSMRQWMDWTEQLDDAGCEWSVIPSKNPDAHYNARRIQANFQKFAIWMKESHLTANPKSSPKPCEKGS